MIDNDYYFTDLAAAYVRGSLSDHEAEMGPETLLRAATAAGLKLNRFKRTRSLPRVASVLGALHGIVPESILDIGSDRGVFLWPLLDAFPSLNVVSIDQAPARISHIDAVRRGGIDRLSACVMDTTCFGFPGNAFDVVTILEVLEHLERPEAAAREALRVARRFVIASVPSKEDDNPEHIRLFSGDSMAALFRDAGARHTKIDYVLNHMICIAGL